jgi:5-(carboxyamino)imidazole ribonucleotide synthase
MDPRTGLPVVGMVGAGQLARMTHQAAIALGQSLRIMAGSADDGAALVAADVVTGDHTSYPDLAAFAAGCDVLTFDHEHVPNDLVSRLAEAGHAVYPAAPALRYAQDKRAMRERLAELGVPVPRWVPLPPATEGPTSALAAFGEQVGWPVVLKASRGGYDGKGVWVLPAVDAAGAVLRTGIPLIAEEYVPLRRELCALVARSPFGQGAAWPVVQTVQSGGICVLVRAPAPDLDPDLAAQAQSLALKLAADLGVVGVLAVELFDTARGLVVNELAMRPHNSGHWTIEGARTSQFEQHLRAVLDYPLGATDPTAPAVAMANVLGWPAGGPGIDERVHHLLARWPDVKVHLYGKAVRPGRKVGHVTALGDDPTEVAERAGAAAGYLAEGGHG